MIIAFLKYLPQIIKEKAIDENYKILDNSLFAFLMLLHQTKESTGTSIGRTGKALLLDKYMIQFLKDKKAHNIQMYDNNHHPKVERLLSHSLFMYLDMEMLYIIQLIQKERADHSIV